VGILYLWNSPVTLYNEFIGSEMTYEMMPAGINNSTPSSLMRPGDPFEIPNFPSSSSSSFKPPMNISTNFTGRPHTLTLAEQAELEFELRYRGNMIVDQQRKIQLLEEELKRNRDQMEVMSSQLITYEQERIKEKKKPQSRYWTPEEHQRFLEALNKFGHKDVKAISMHVSTRNATQVRTHAQKYFLRLERERRKKPDGSFDKDSTNDGYGSSDMEDGFSPEPVGSPLEDSLNTPTLTRRKRSSSFTIAPTQAKLSAEHREVVLNALPGWTSDDYDQFVKGLTSHCDKPDMDMSSICRAIGDQYLSHHPIEEVETCYRQLQKCLKQKTSLMSSPKRRRANSKPEPPVTQSITSTTNNPFPAFIHTMVGNSGMNTFANPGQSVSLHPFHSAPSGYSVSSSLTPMSAPSLSGSLARNAMNSGQQSLVQILEVPRRSMNHNDYGTEFGHDAMQFNAVSSMPSGFAFAFNPFHENPGMTSSAMVSSHN